MSTGTALYDILPTSYGGRGAYARDFISKGTPILFCSGPYASVIFWKFRREVCATCFAYAFESGKSKWNVKAGGDDRSAGGAWFCSEKCREYFVEEFQVIEGAGMDWWHEINGAFNRLMLQMAKGVKPNCKALPVTHFKFLEEITAADVTQSFIDDAWRLVEMVSLEESKQRWVEELNEYELDTAKFVLDGLVRKIIEDFNPISTSLDRIMPNKNGHCMSAGRWADLLELQDNEYPPIRSKPYTLVSRIRIYRFLRHLSVSLSNASKNRASRSGSGTPEASLAPLPSMVDRLKAVLSTSVRARSLMARDHGNAFGIWDIATEEQGSEMLGWAAYVFGSYFNHDCNPNLKKDRVGRGIQFYTVRDVQPGEELCISYIDETSPDPQERIGKLEKDWFFSCSCTRCTSELETL